MITVTEEAKELFLNVDYPDGTVLRLDPVVHQNTGETQIGISAGEPMSNDQVVEHDGASLLHIAGLVSKALDDSTRRTGHRHHHPRLYAAHRRLVGRKSV